MESKSRKKAEVKIGAALAAAIMNDPKGMKVPWCRFGFRRTGGWFAGTAIHRSKYKPHQGEREKTRHLAQIAKGMIGDAHV